MKTLSYIIPQPEPLRVYTDADGREYFGIAEFFNSVVASRHIVPAWVERFKAHYPNDDSVKLFTNSLGAKTFALAFDAIAQFVAVQGQTASRLPKVRLTDLARQWYEAKQRERWLNPRGVAEFQAMKKTTQSQERPLFKGVDMTRDDVRPAYEEVPEPSTSDVHAYVCASSCSAFFSV